MVTLIQERHIMLDMKIGDGNSDKRTTYYARYGDFQWGQLYKKNIECQIWK